MRDEPKLEFYYYLILITPFGVGEVKRFSSREEAELYRKVWNDLRFIFGKLQLQSILITELGELVDGSFINFLPWLLATAYNTLLVAEEEDVADSFLNEYRKAWGN